MCLHKIYAQSLCNIWWWYIANCNTRQDIKWYNMLWCISRKAWTIISWTSIWDEMFRLYTVLVCHKRDNRFQVVYLVDKGMLEKPTYDCDCRCTHGFTCLMMNYIVHTELDVCFNACITWHYQCFQILSHLAFCTALGGQSTMDVCMGLNPRSSRFLLTDWK